ncbi:hypothetical protein [Lysobacter sp. A3-1-A15]|uniref:hypothetical protein n=1 Tax=Novilysobacter viscosus TaxID=3098602 RepID=UPI002ED859A7
MDWERYLAPAAMALSAMPVFLIAGLVRGGRLHLVNGLDASRVRDPERLARRLGALLAAVGFSVLLGAAGLAWAGSDEARVTGVVIGLLLAVNGLAVALILTVARARRVDDQGQRPGSRSTRR